MVLEESRRRVIETGSRGRSKDAWGDDTKGRRAGTRRTRTLWREEDGCSRWAGVPEERFPSRCRGIMGDSVARDRPVKPDA